MSVGACKGPIFVVGSMGSGTTLMRLILDSHENVAIAQETTFMRAVLAHKWIPFWRFGGEWYQRVGWTEEELNAELRQFYGRIFGRFAQQQGAQRWGDKSPHHLWHLREAATVFPDAVFVVTVRHPGAVMSSLKTRFHWDFRDGLNHWRRAHAEIAHRAEDLGDRMVVSRYEDMVLDLEPTMRAVLDLIGEPWSSRVLEHHVVHAERGSPTKVEGKTRSTDPVDRARVAKWVEHVDDAGRELLHEVQGLAAFYGYDVDHPEQTAPFGSTEAGRAGVLTGTDLRKRQSDFPEVDWSYRPKPGMANQMLRPQKYQVVAVPKKKGERTGKATASDRKGNADGTSSSGVRTLVSRLPAPARSTLRKIVKGL